MNALRKERHIRHNRISLTVFLGVLSGWTNYIIVHCCDQVWSGASLNLSPHQVP